MPQKILTITVMLTVLANMAVGSLCHVHGEFSDPNGRPHLHLGHHQHHHHDGHHHHHDHSEHGLAHDHDQSHHRGQDAESLLKSTPLSHDCDVVYLTDIEVLLPRFDRDTQNILKVSQFQSQAICQPNRPDRGILRSMPAPDLPNSISSCAHGLKTVRLLL